MGKFESFPWLFCLLPAKLIRWYKRRFLKVHQMYMVLLFQRKKYQLLRKKNEKVWLRQIIVERKLTFNVITFAKITFTSYCLSKSFENKYLVTIRIQKKLFLRESMLMLNLILAIINSIIVNKVVKCNMAKSCEFSRLIYIIIKIVFKFLFVFKRSFDIQVCIQTTKFFKNAYERLNCWKKVWEYISTVERMISKKKLTHSRFKWLTFVPWAFFSCRKPTDLKK